MKTLWIKNFEESKAVLEQFIGSAELLGQCENFASALESCYKAKGKALSCGNGGSHCDAMHFAEELTGQFRGPRRPLGAIALGDPSHVTCTSNDFGFEYVFSRQVEALGHENDVLVALSTSGNSKNVIRAVESAKNIGMKTVGLLGKTGGELKSMVDVPIVVPAQTSDRIQEMHIKIIHTVIEAVERKLFPENY
jgi:D-sedoheptulose 7-phosphate isomerase